MADDTAAVSGSACPWCSAPLPAGEIETCPSCGAQLVPDTDAAVPGVTAIDPEAIVRAAHQPTPQRRNRLLSWISGEYDAGEEPIAPGSVAPPDPAVRREMLRLVLEAEVANLQAEAGMVLAEAEVEAHEEGQAVAAAEPLDAAAESLDAAAESDVPPEMPDAPAGTADTPAGMADEPGAADPAADAPAPDRS
jgi:hypothetical protein